MSAWEMLSTWLSTVETDAQVLAALVILVTVTVTVLTKHKGKWYCRKDEMRIRTPTCIVIFLPDPLWGICSPW